MIIFKKVKYKNFLSGGNVFNEINFVDTTVKMQNRLVRIQLIRERKIIKQTVLLFVLQALQILAIVFW